jgi:hypothetical protein
VCGERLPPVPEPDPPPVGAGAFVPAVVVPAVVVPVVVVPAVVVSAVVVPAVVGDGGRVAGGTVSSVAPVGDDGAGVVAGVVTSDVVVSFDAVKASGGECVWSVAATIAATPLPATISIAGISRTASGTRWRGAPPAAVLPLEEGVLGNPPGGPGVPGASCGDHVGRLTRVGSGGGGGGGTAPPSGAFAAGGPTGFSGGVGTRFAGVGATPPGRGSFGASGSPGTLFISHRPGAATGAEVRHLAC